MRIPPALFGIVGAMVLSGCQTTSGLQTPDADLARQVMAKHCMVGDISLGVNGKQRVRVGKVAKRSDALAVNHKHRIQPEFTTVYSIEERKEGWMVVDASTKGARDNFYFNYDTGEFACSTDEWRAASNWRITGMKFETDFMISPKSFNN